MFKEVVRLAPLCRCNKSIKPFQADYLQPHYMTAACVDVWRSLQNLKKIITKSKLNQIAVDVPKLNINNSTVHA